MNRRNFGGDSNLQELMKSDEPNTLHPEPVAQIRVTKTDEPEPAALASPEHVEDAGEVDSPNPKQFTCREHHMLDFCKNRFGASVFTVEDLYKSASTTNSKPNIQELNRFLSSFAIPVNIATNLNVHQLRGFGGLILTVRARHYFKVMAHVTT